MSLSYCSLDSLFMTKGLKPGLICCLCKISGLSWHVQICSDPQDGSLHSKSFAHTDKGMCPPVSSDRCDAKLPLYCKRCSLVPLKTANWEAEIWVVSRTAKCQGLQHHQPSCKRQRYFMGMTLMNYKAVQRPRALDYKCWRLPLEPI